MATALLRRSVGVLLALLFAVLALGISAGAANAADGYRYWNYFHLKDNAWAFSQVGPADYDAKDGAVEGYRFGTSATADGIPPRADLAKVSFDTVCGNTKPAAGKKRVAVVIDYGTTADATRATPPAPRAVCAVVATNANGSQVLQNVADARIEKGLTCGIDGYPASGCGDPVANAKPAGNEPAVAFDLPQADTPTTPTTKAATEAQDDNSLNWPLVGVGVVVLLIAGGGLALSRRNGTA